MPSWSIVPRRHRALRPPGQRCHHRVPAPLPDPARCRPTDPGPVRRVPAPHRLLRPQSVDELYARVSDAPPAGLSAAEADGHAVCVLALLRAVETVHNQERELEAEIIERLDAHADAHIFTTLPRAGHGVRAATLLAEIGDVRARFPDEESLAALAGVAPVTKASGNYHAVGFRWAADKKLRNALIDFADDSRNASPWAAQVYDDAITRGKRHQHAVRILARAWVRVIWRCRQDHAAYDTQLHGGAMQIAA